MLYQHKHYTFDIDMSNLFLRERRLRLPSNVS